MLSGEQIAAAVQGAAWPLYAVGMGMSGSLLTLFTAALGAGLHCAREPGACRLLCARSPLGTAAVRRASAAKNITRPAASAGCLPQEETAQSS